MPQHPPPSIPAQADVVLLHGAWLPSWTLTYLAHALRHYGYACRRYAYPTVHRDLSYNVERLQRFLLRQRLEACHLVGHSLGGLLIRALMQHHPELPLGRAVMLGTPLQGSYVAQCFARHTLSRILLGRSVPQAFAPDNASAVFSAEVGMIAGSAGVGLGMLFRGLASPNDGTIAVAETRDPGLHDHLVLPVSHSSMLLSTQVAAQIHAFFMQGRFQSPAKS